MEDARRKASAAAVPADFISADIHRKTSAVDTASVAATPTAEAGTPVVTAEAAILAGTAMVADITASSGGCPRLAFETWGISEPGFSERIGTTTAPLKPPKKRQKQTKAGLTGNHFPVPACVLHQLV